MIALKDYQNRVLDSLQGFFQICSKEGTPVNAFQKIQIQNNVAPVAYLPIQAAGLTAATPYVCIRVPTGGGKTLLACYAAGIATTELLHAERSVVLWLVPSNTILEQTLKALRDKAHPYRRALETACGQVEVVSIEEALHLSRATVDGQTVVIVSTIQSFRVENQDGRKVYDTNGDLLEHFLNLPLNREAELLPGPDGKPQTSLANVLRLRRPVVIVDEAHNARTLLSFSTLGAVLPACIIEFTATPARMEQPSNVLHRVSAFELKEADMIKLPLRILTRDPSQRDQLLSEAIELRSSLEKFAIVEGQQTGEYIRPIMLIQAERVDACEPLRDRLVNELGIPKDQIKISNGKLDELKKIENISDPECPVRFIITVEKLREGWDCPFAYVLCSLKETHSATAIEQIVGRILRLPSAKSKQHPDLNSSYAFSVSHSIYEVLDEFRQALESNGFTTAEAERIVFPVNQPILPLGSQPKTIFLDTSTELDVNVAQALEPAFGGKVKFDVAKGGVTIVVPLTQAETEKVMGSVKTPEAKIKVKNLIDSVAAGERALKFENLAKVPSPFELRLNFIVPKLGVAENGKLIDFDETFILEYEWRLGEKDASLSAAYNPAVKPDITAGVVDVSRSGKLETYQAHDQQDVDFVTKLHQHVMQLGIKSDWTQDGLIRWLDRHINHKDIPFNESAIFLRKVTIGLMLKYRIEDIDVLANDRYRLRDEIENKIQEYRESERTVAFQQFLMPDSKLTVDDTFSIDFKEMGYEPGWLYDGHHKFQKHYFGNRPGELNYSSPAGGPTEEFKCAQFIDSMTEVKYWIRNLSRRNTSFRLQTSRDWFYPDFVCQLNDGRVLVVEYKGEYIYGSPDSEEKRIIGELWASRSKGKCLFVMPTGKNYLLISDVIKKSV